MASFRFFLISLFFAMASKSVHVAAQNDPCYFCGGDATATISNPDVVIDLSGLGTAVPVPSATCQQIFDAGLSGLVDATSCQQATYTALGIEYQKTCGCSRIASLPPGATPVPSPVTTPSSGATTPAPVATTPAPVATTPAPVATTEAPAPPTAVGPNPPCYLCGGDANATINNPDTTIDLTPLGLPTATCKQILDAGLQGYIDPTQCQAAIYSSQGVAIQSQCGCSTVASASPTVPNVATPPPATLSPTQPVAPPTTTPPVLPPTTSPPVTVPVTVPTTTVPPSQRAPTASSERVPTTPDAGTSPPVATVNTPAPTTPAPTTPEPTTPEPTTPEPATPSPSSGSPYPTGFGTPAPTTGSSSSATPFSSSSATPSNTQLLSSGSPSPSSASDVPTSSGLNQQARAAGLEDGAHYEPFASLSAYLNAKLDFSNLEERERKQRSYTKFLARMSRNGDRHLLRHIPDNDRKVQS